MKFLSLVAATVLLSSTTLFATDIIVYAGSPTASIQNAINAASDGDRIVVQNIGDTVRWIGNFTIDKSLDFVSYDNNTPFYVQGNVTITPAANRNINIIGMNIRGNINLSASTGATKVSLSDAMVYGSVNLAGSSVEAFIGGSTIHSGVTASYATIVGNIIYNGVSITNAYTGTITTTNKIIGNRINNGNINYNNNTPFRINNNYIYLPSSSASIYIASYSPTAASNAYIENNTTYAYLNCISIAAASNSNATIYIQNNHLHIYVSSSSYYPISTNTSIAATLICNYNYHSQNNTAYLSNNPSLLSGLIYSNIGFDVATGTLNAGHPGINGGHPHNKYSDLDLTRNDVGIHGGSYAHTNFFPLYTGSARTLFVDLNDNFYIQGQTLNIKAVGIDR